MTTMVEGITRVDERNKGVCEIRLESSSSWWFAHQLYTTTGFRCDIITLLLLLGRLGMLLYHTPPPPRRNGKKDM
jgi:hypothetical protein